jgi:NAD(P)-dependent dehydrogenase (short-subunit alcohol dehydrogenase family)
MKIQDSVAFVTGAHRGLGLAFTKELLGRGVKKVYAGMRNPNGLDLPGVVPIKVDVTDPASASAAAGRPDEGIDRPTPPPATTRFSTPSGRGVPKASLAPQLL